MIAQSNFEPKDLAFINEAELTNDHLDEMKGINQAVLDTVKTLGTSLAEGIQQALQKDFFLKLDGVETVLLKGDTPVIDYEKIISEVTASIPIPTNGKDIDETKIVKAVLKQAIPKILKAIPIPTDGVDGKDAVINIEEITKNVLSQITLPEYKEETPITIAEKVNTLEKVIDFKVLKNIPQFRGKGAMSLPIPTSLHVVDGSPQSGDVILAGSVTQLGNTFTFTGGAAAVSSVSNADGTLTISPTTGAVVASLNLAKANTWTATQTFDKTAVPGISATFKPRTSVKLDIDYITILGGTNYPRLRPLASDNSAVLIQQGGVFLYGDVSLGYMPYLYFIDGSNDAITSNIYQNSVGELTVTSAKVFFGCNVAVNDDPYSVSWNGNVEVPTKNAVYDKIQSLPTNTGQATVNFGATENDSATVTVATASILTASKIVVSVFGGTTADHDPDDVFVEELLAYATNIVNGVSFDIVCKAPNNTFGQFVVNYYY